MKGIKGSGESYCAQIITVMNTSRARDRLLGQPHPVPDSSTTRIW